VGRRKQVYKITYPHGTISVGMDLTGSMLYSGSPSAAEQIASDHSLDREDLTFTIRKEILWESESAADTEVRAMETKLIRWVSSSRSAPLVVIRVGPGC
jgi:hypothetical protein